MVIQVTFVADLVQKGANKDPDPVAQMKEKSEGIEKETLPFGPWIRAQKRGIGNYRGRRNPLMTEPKCDDHSKARIRFSILRDMEKDPGIEDSRMTDDRMELNGDDSGE